MKHTKKPIVNPFPVINPLDEKSTPTKRKISWKIKAPILLVLAIALIAGVNAFFNTYYLISPIKFQNPFRVRGYEYPITIKESELDKIIKEEIDKGKAEIKKETSMIVKPVQAQEPDVDIVVPIKKYTYTNYSKLEHYDEIIAYLKTIYTNWEDAAELTAREASFNPHVINSIGACGLPQALPCSKMKCELTDIKCQLDWQKEYVSDRYGTITKALDHSYKLNWY